jgi:hypothetical protein
MLCCLKSHAQFVTITDTGITDLSGAPLPNGLECFAPVNNQRVPIAANYPGGTITKVPKCSPIVTGVMTPIQLVASNVTSPVNLCYLRTIVDSSTGKQVIGPLDGYACVQPTANTNMNTVVPSLGGLALAVTGPAGPAGPALSYRGMWSSSTTYANGDVVTYSNALYVSSVSSNLNNTPSSSPSQWNVSGVSTGTGSGIPVGCSVNTSTDKCMGVSPYLAVSGDYSAAYTQVMVDLCASGAAGGNVYLPDGVYALSGSSQDTSGANSIVPAPKIVNYGTQLCKIAFIGFHDPNNGEYNGAQITTTGSSGNLFGGYDSSNTSGGGYPPFTNVELTFKNVTFVAPTNPGIVVVNGTYLQAVRFVNVLCRTVNPSSLSAVTNTAGGCLYMPSILNSYQNYVDNVTFAGFYTNVILTEHTLVGAIYSEISQRGVVMDTGFNSAAPSTYHGNSVHVDYLWAGFGNCAVSAGSNTTVASISNLDSELNSHDVCDNTASYLHLSGGWLNPYNSATATLGITGGGAHVSLQNLYYPESWYPSSAPVNLNSGLIEFWRGAEGSGTTFGNAGTDSTNVQTLTSVTWGSASGFTGNVPIYDGTTSHAIAASATGTSFTSTQPWTACYWHNPTTYSGVSSVFALSNLGTPLGWGVGEFGSSVGAPGSIFVYLYVDGSHNIAVNSILGGLTLTAGVAANVCVTYDGSKIAAGVSIYVNATKSGGIQVVSDTLGTGSMVSSNPMHIGDNVGENSFMNGAIGGVRIYNRVLSSAELTAIYNEGPNGI